MSTDSAANAASTPAWLEACQTHDLTLALRAELLEAAAAWSHQSLETLSATTDLQACMLTRPPKPELGDFAFPCFPLAKALRRSPAQVAEQLVPAALARFEEAARAGRIPAVAKLAPAGPYLNIHLDAGDLARFICAQVAAGAPPFGAPLPSTGRRTVVEYSGPNTNKPLHLGHTRNNVLGMGMCNILAATGEDVVPVNIVNDRGIHIAKSMVAYRRWGAGRTPESEDVKGDHFVGEFYVRYGEAIKGEKAELARREGLDPEHLSDEDDRRIEDACPLTHETRAMLRAWEEGDADTRALWSTMNGWVYSGFDETYARLGCVFQKWYLESETYELGKGAVRAGLEQGLFVQHADGSVWAPLEQDGLKDKILLRADGTSVYITQDIGTATVRYDDYHMDRLVYIVASEQNLHFQLLFMLLRKLGYPWAAACHHLNYGMVNLPHGMGKLKSREGRKIDADTMLDELAATARRKAEEGGYASSAEVDLDLLAEAIGQGALKLYLLEVSAEKDITFDPDKTLDFEGDTGPAVQYSHARIRSITRKALAEGKITPADLVTGQIARPFAGMGTASPVPAPVQAPWRRWTWRRATESGGRTGSALASRATGLASDRVRPELLSGPEEKRLALELAFLPSVLRQAAAQLSPAPLANYLLDLTKTYARFYHNCPVLRAGSEELMRARLHLSLATAAVLRRGLALLGIEAPDAM
jgi:arginyl-tRNA synthetase